jgi:hypothetical protein
MPYHRLERFRQRRDPGGIHLRDDDDHVAMSRGVSSVLADDPEHLGGAFFREVDRADKIGADVALGVATADRKYQNRVVAIEPAGLQPGGEDGVPALVVGARGLVVGALALFVLLWSLAAVGMLWSEASWAERIHGLGGFHRLLMIPLLLTQFRRSEHGVWVLWGFPASAVVLLLVCWASRIQAVRIIDMSDSNADTASPWRLETCQISSRRAYYLSILSVAGRLRSPKQRIW